MNVTCTFCQIRAFEKILNKLTINENKKKQALKQFLGYISEIPDTINAPQTARDIHALIRQILNNPDPYKKEKDFANRFLMDKYAELKQIVKKSDNPLETAMRMAIAGNVIDFGPGHDFDIDKTIKKVLSIKLALDDSENLLKKIKTAKNILYLGDNCGEIVLDKLFIETMNRNNITFAVRNSPILNDATEKEALQVGIDKYAKIISNGYDAPATILSKSSADFNRTFENADLVIAKGMGNFEGLMNDYHHNLFFLLMIKCEMVGRFIHVPKGEFVVLKQNQELARKKL